MAVGSSHPSPSAPYIASAHAMQAGTTEYWNDIAADWQLRGQQGAWRMVSDTINLALLASWLPAGDSVLKTDLFDEFVGVGLVPALGKHYDRVSGIDLSPTIVDVVGGRYPGLRAHCADVRSLPFDDATFDAVLSNSTLDHFRSLSDVTKALAELHRVMRPGGRLLITLDNAANPVVALRNALPERMRAASHLVPFAVGATCGPRRLSEMLTGTGFDVIRQTAIVHCPRVLAVLAGNLLDRVGSAQAKRRYSRLIARFEGLAKLPTRYVSGHFVAALALKRA